MTFDPSSFRADSIDTDGVGGGGWTPIPNGTWLGFMSSVECKKSAANNYMIVCDFTTMTTDEYVQDEHVIKFQNFTFANDMSIAIFSNMVKRVNPDAAKTGFDITDEDSTFKALGNRPVKFRTWQKKSKYVDREGVTQDSVNISMFFDFDLTDADRTALKDLYGDALVPVAQAVSAVPGGAQQSTISKNDIPF